MDFPSSSGNNNRFLVSNHQIPFKFTQTSKYCNFMELGSLVDKSIALSSYESLVY